MSRSKHTEAQIIAALKQVEAGRTPTTWLGSAACPSTPSMAGRPAPNQRDLQRQCRFSFTGRTVSLISEDLRYS